MKYSKKLGAIQKSFIVFVTLFALILPGCSTAPDSVGNDISWQEQYDLGMKFLSEGNYEEAVVSFTAAIKIDPKQAPAYVGRGDAYYAQNEYALARADYEYALELDPTLDLKNKINALEEASRIEDTEKLQEELYPFVADLEIPFTVDDIALGITDIDAAKAAYSSRPYAFSNLMDEDTVDTVYTCFGNGMPIPEGHKQDEFGFIFSAPVESGIIDWIAIQDPNSSFDCLGGLHIGDNETAMLNFFGLPQDVVEEDMVLQWTLKNGATFIFSKYDTENAEFTYHLDGKEARVDFDEYSAPVAHP